MIQGEPDFLNFIKTPDWWEYTGRYHFPVVKGLKVKSTFQPELVEFHEAHRVANTKRKSKIVHFFLPDYLFERTWSRVDPTTEFLSTFKAVLMPDFSRYTDMPLAMQIWNCYRKMWVSKYWQDAGLTVIPTAGWSNELSYNFCFDGMPKHSLIAVSSLGTQNDKEAMRLFRKGYEKMQEVLKPSRILFYGKMPDWLDKSIVIHVPHARDQRFKALKAKKED